MHWLPHRNWKGSWQLHQTWGSVSIRKSESIHRLPVEYRSHCRRMPRKDSHGYFLNVARLKRMAAGTSLSRLFINTTSAASMATSVPAPIAIPMSALVSAGGIIDSVSYHGNLSPVPSENGSHFPCHPEEHLQLHRPLLPVLRSLCGCAFIITGKHYYPDSHVLQFFLLPEDCLLYNIATAIMPRSFLPFAKRSGVFPSPCKFFLPASSVSGDTEVSLLINFIFPPVSTSLFNAARRPFPGRA